MELAILVYVVETLTNNGALLFTFFLLSVACAVIAFLYTIDVEKYNRPAKTVRNLLDLDREGQGLNLQVTTTKDIGSRKIFIPAGTTLTITRIWYDGDVDVKEYTRDQLGVRLTKYLLKRDCEEGLIELPAINVQSKYKPKPFVILACILLFLDTVIPSKTTAYYMAGAYMVQQVVGSDKAKELGSLSYEAVRNQLKAWSKSDDPELAAKMVALTAQLEGVKQE